jgi:transposase
MYDEFVHRCTLESFLDCHLRAFPYLGGVPAEVLYDNMKHVVLRRLGGQVEFNAELMHCAHHYGFQTRPCPPPYSPWVKGKVERPVDYIRERFWRGYLFRSIEQPNRDLGEWLPRVAHVRIHGTHRQPIRKRLQQEKAHWGPASGSGLRHLGEDLP